MRECLRVKKVGWYSLSFYILMSGVLDMWISNYVLFADDVMVLTGNGPNTIMEDTNHDRQRIMSLIVCLTAIFVCVSLRGYGTV